MMLFNIFIYIFQRHGEGKGMWPNQFTYTVSDSIALHFSFFYFNFFKDTLKTNTITSTGNYNCSYDILV